MELRLFFYLFKIFYPKLKKIKINKNKRSLFLLYKEPYKKLYKELYKEWKYC